RMGKGLFRAHLLCHELFNILVRHDGHAIALPILHFTTCLVFLRSRKSILKTGTPSIKYTLE
ncbi:MAG: hypothetical protein KAI17_06635, partial [Thiotrichaceae bacterium]|nr:hypothetical protein [Thiotrichaceae bacterium]